MESVIYKRGSGWEGYIVLVDDAGYVVTSGGFYRLLVNNNPQSEWRHITCSDFQAFETRGSGWRMGFLFFVPAQSKPTVQFYTTRITCSGDGVTDNCTKR